MGIFRKDYKKVNAGFMPQPPQVMPAPTQTINTMQGYEPSPFTISTTSQVQQPVQQQERKDLYTSPTTVVDTNKELVIKQLLRLQEEVEELDKKLEYIDASIKLLLRYLEI